MKARVPRNVGFRAQYKGNDANGDPIIDAAAKLPTLAYEGTVKLHGGNLSICIHPDGSYNCQSRERVITEESDCYGFARWVNNLPGHVLNTFYDQITDTGSIVLYGEWVGKGINNKAAITQLPEKSWFIFAARLVDGEEERWVNIENLMTPNDLRIYNIYQFKTYRINIDFENHGESVNKLNEITAEVEKCCPVAKDLGINGIGEGVVWKCIEPGWESSKYWHKVKGADHAGSAVKILAAVDVEKMKSINDFVDKHVNEERLMQSWNWLAENKKEQTEKSTGDFIRWVHEDVLKEESDELEASGLTKKDLGSVLSRKARGWFLNKVNNI